MRGEVWMWDGGGVGESGSLLFLPPDRQTKSIQYRQHSAPARSPARSLARSLTISLARPLARPLTHQGRGALRVIRSEVLLLHLQGVLVVLQGPLPITFVVVHEADVVLRDRVLEVLGAEEALLDVQGPLVELQRPVDVLHAVEQHAQVVERVGVARVVDADGAQLHFEGLVVVVEALVQAPALPRDPPAEIKGAPAHRVGRLVGVLEEARRGRQRGLRLVQAGTLDVHPGHQIAGMRLLAPLRRLHCGRGCGGRRGGCAPRHGR